MNRHAASRRLARTPVAAFSFALALVALASVTSADDTLAGRSGAEANDGLVVIAHPDLAMSSIDGEGIRRLFLGKSRKLPNGARAELASYGPASSFFNERVLAMSDVRGRHHLVSPAVLGPHPAPGSVRLGRRGGRVRGGDPERDRLRADERAARRRARLLRRAALKFRRLPGGARTAAAEGIRQQTLTGDVGRMPSSPRRARWPATSR